MLHVFILLPLLGFVLSIFIPGRKEPWLSRLAFFTTGFNLVLSIGFIIQWVIRGSVAIHLKDLSVYSSDHYDFFIDFYFDKISAVYLLVGSLLTFLVAVYSRYYLHRETGYKRFFSTILFFYTGFTIIILSGNFETLFVGWEILGISSFLLIGFYRQRYLPVKNALKVFTIYRIGDVGILLAMWMSHHLWKENITFLELNNYAWVDEQFTAHTSISVFVSLMILLAAAAKSAQLPFSAWLPRAMEGPTPSSAIFYGSLSVHIGAFLLLRTFPFWEHQWGIRIAILALGFISAIITSLIARVQANVKSQIAYSSAAQIGIIFMEIAAGLDTLALIHFAGNAFLRTYQLLISPSVVTYLIREQFYNAHLRKIRNRKYLPRVWRNTLYMLSIREWYLDSFVFRVFFNPLKKMRRLVGFLNLKNLLLFFLPLYIGGFYLAYIQQPWSDDWKNVLSVSISLIALLMVAKAYNERESSRLSWLLIVFALFFIDLAITFNDRYNASETAMYLGGIMISGIVGFICLVRINRLEKGKVGLNRFHGLVTKYPVTAFTFLLASLGLTGFPITTTFLGEDIILTHIRENQVILACLVALTFIINGIAVLRIYARVFLGASERNYQTKPELTA